MTMRRMFERTEQSELAPLRLDVRALVGSAPAFCLLATLFAIASMAAARAETQPAHAGMEVHKNSAYRPIGQVRRESEHFRALWGVDKLAVRRVASGSLIRFSYHVVDPARAGVLNAERDIPYLIAPTRGVVLQIPTLEQVGDLRQKGQPVAGMTYWMAFSNKHEPVKVGDRVNIAIGTFHAEGLIVE